jgi:tetratricopeptide (TPR) repeat protein
MSALAVGIAFSGCSPLKKMKDKAEEVKYTVDPPVLELVGDQVSVSINGSYPPKYFNKNVIMTLTPTLQSGSNELDLDAYKVQGESVKENNKVVKYNDGGSFSYTSKVTYKPEFQLSELMLKASATKGNKSLDFDPYKLADGIITTCLLVEKTGKATYAADKYVRITPDAYEADIKYLIQQSDVRTAETKKPEIKEFTETVKAAAANERIQFTSTQLSAYASPDGPYALNEKLSNSREKTGKDFFIKNFKAAKVEDVVKSDLLKVVVTPEDWDGFKKLMEASDIADKQLVLRVLSMYSDPEVRDREIHNIAAAFDEIKVKILPQLRRSKMTVNVEIIGLSDQEINAQFDSDPSKLKLEEILYAGTLTQDDNRKLSIYQAAARYYPSDYRTKNNLGVALLNLGRNSEAKTALDDAKNIESNELVKNNLAVVALREGNLTAAEELLTAVGSSDDVKFNLGTIKIIQGKYSEAISYFGNLVEVNAALDKLLAKQHDAALSTLNSVKSDDALVYYLKAVVGARTQNTDLMMNNLRTACSKSAELKTNAKKDIEFGKYFQDNTFKSIVQ